MNWIDQCLNDPTGQEGSISLEWQVHSSPDGSISIPYRVAAPNEVQILRREEIKEEIERLRAIAKGLEFFCDLASDEEIQEINERTRRRHFPENEAIEQRQIYPSLSRLYILQAGALAVYKIGKGKPEERIKSIKRQHCRHSLSLYYCSADVDNALTRERAIHTLYTHDRIPPAEALEMGLGKDGFTEWFRLTERKLEEITYMMEAWAEETQLSLFGEEVGS